MGTDFTVEVWSITYGDFKEVYDGNDALEVMRIVLEKREAGYKRIRVTYRP